MFNVTHHQGNANKNRSEIAPHPCLNDRHQINQQTTGVGEDVEQREPACAAVLLLRLQIGAATMENSMEVPQTF